MTDDTDRRYRSRYRHETDTLGRVRAYLLSRPSECWLFFLAGIAAGAVLG